MAEDKYQKESVVIVIPVVRVPIFKIVIDKLITNNKLSTFINRRGKFDIFLLFKIIFQTKPHFLIEVTSDQRM